ncbi:MAG: 4-hydroxybenzoate 3-monooxygenase [Saprospiraceae bacterium]|nr:4-hydroxybenzoate 3-monooxygenase [Lewinella sp.]
MKTTTQIGIIGAGPAGLFLSRQLHLWGIDNIVLEHRSRHYVENRLRAGLLEQNTVDMLRELGVSANLDERGIPHHGVMFSFNGERVHIPFDELTGGRHITIYGQRFVVRDLIKDLVDDNGKVIHFEAEAKRIEGIESKNPVIHYEQNGETHELHCDFVAACDGYHGIGRETLPTHTFRRFDIEYPFSWLGILAETPPSSDELIYAFHKEGFALLSYRSPKISRLYLQVDNDDHVDNWPDERIWESLHTRLGTPGWTLNEGPIIQKGITPMRSYMIDGMQHGRMYLAGDAAHIVPPTGGKGLNLAVADIKILATALKGWYENGDERGLQAYTQDCLRRVWRYQHFSNFMTRQFHRQHDFGSFDYELQKAQFDYIRRSVAMRTTIAENYVGLKEI